ncbi:hypothetical protein ACTWPT_30495 [Nonomuraea sp. 3N208]|uniref:hypothetical protein n=1 Tax=Nonomuraea sp. 3N208 TaxID=3457421 RepID=UPI003FD0638E
MMYQHLADVPSRHPTAAQPRTLVTDPAGLFTELIRLNLPHGDYVVCGSAALYVRNLRTCMGDLDVLARGAAWCIALALGVTPSTAPSGHGQVINHPAFAIEFVDRWTPGWSTHYLIETADLIDGIPFMRLGDVLAWKACARRPKDLPDISAIDNLRRLWSAPLAGPVPGRPRPSRVQDRAV